MKVDLINKFRACAIACLLASLAQSAAVFAQTYTFTASNPGYNEIAFGDFNSPYYPNLSPYAQVGEYTGVTADLGFGTVNGSLIYNSASSTMQFMGTVAVSPASSTLSFSDEQKVNGNLIAANVTINYVIGNVSEGNMSFDTGALSPLTTTSGPPNTDMWLATLSVPVDGTYSLVTGGKTYAGAFSYTIPMPLQIAVQSVAPTGMSFSQFTQPFNEYGQGTIANVLADNGFDMDLEANDPGPGSGGAFDFDWSVSGVASPVVPEPPPLAILACGLLGLALFRLRRGTA